MEHIEFIRAEQNGILCVQIIISRTLLALNEPLPPDDIDALSELSVMRVYPTGKEDIREVMSRVSTSTLNKMAGLSRGQMDDPLVSQFFHFVYLEWCFRNGLMITDWEFTWVSEKEGSVKYTLNQTTRSSIKRLHNCCLSLHLF